MKLTQEQFDALAPYQKHFETAVNHRWTRFPGGAALDLIHDTLKKVTGMNVPLNKCCSHCILELMTDMGRIFLADLEEKKRTEVAVQESMVAEPVKVEVKTETKPKRKYTRKPKTQE